MTPSRRLLLLAGATGLALLSACVTLYPVPAGVNLIEPKRLQTLIEVSPPQTRRSDTGTLQASVSVRNHSESRIVIEGRAMFRGAPQGAEPATGWKRIFIQRDSSESLSFLALSERSGEVLIELREGQR